MPQATFMAVLFEYQPYLLAVDDTVFRVVQSAEANAWFELVPHQVRLTLGYVAPGALFILIAASTASL